MSKQTLDFIAKITAVVMIVALVVSSILVAFYRGVMPHYDISGYKLNWRQRRRAPVQREATPVQDHIYTSIVLPQPTAAPARSALPTRHRSNSRWLGVVMLVVLSALIGATAVSLVWLDRMYVGRIYPNVKLQGVDLSHHTLPEAKQTVQRTFHAFLQQPITLSYEDRRWQPAPEELGIAVDLDQSLVDTYNAGRGTGLLANIRPLIGLSQQRFDLPLQMEVDAERLRAYLQRVAAEVEQPAREATLTVTEHGVQSTQSAEGRMVLIDKTASEIIRSLQTYRPQVVVLRTRAVQPQVSKEAIAEARHAMEAMLAAPIELVFRKQTFTIGVKALRDMIEVRQDGGKVNVYFDQAKLQQWVTQSTKHIGAPAVEPRVSWNDGALKITEGGQPGWRIDIDRTIDMINEVALTTSRQLELPTEVVQPYVTAETLGTLGITELVSTGKSGFSGSPEYRITNIKAGVKRMDGMVIPPGAEFSFNDNIGEISEQYGFVEGYAIIDNRTQKEMGGGVCQVSTTLFRAAFYAGLPFTAWTPHRFRLDWYERYDTIGMDAAIYTDIGPDLSFINDTKHWLLIQATVDDAEQSVTFHLYGTKIPGRSVERTEPVITNIQPAPSRPVYIDDPEQPIGKLHQTDTARDGMDVEIKRFVKQDGKVVRTDTFLTNFAPWPNIYLKHPRTPLPTGDLGE
jgi:vancomycin resistance protein YoaR